MAVQKETWAAAQEERRVGGGEREGEDWFSFMDLDHASHKPHLSFNQDL